jgi:hypothetical protein
MKLNSLTIDVINILEMDPNSPDAVWTIDKVLKQIDLKLKEIEAKERGLVLITTKN